MSNSLQTLHRLLGALVPAVACYAQSVPAEDLVHLDQQGDRIVARGPGYEATWSADGVQFAGSNQSGAADRPCLSWRLETISRGEPGQGAERAAPMCQDHRVSFGRNGSVERYDLTANGIEQSFVLQTLPPGAGDLVVTLAVSTSLDLVVNGPRGLRFLNRQGAGVSFGGVTGIDAVGVRREGTIRSDGRTIELLLPADFVTAAVLPLVLDPLVTPLLNLSSPHDVNLHPDIAMLGPTDDEALCVFERQPTSITPSLIYGSRITTVATPLGNFIGAGTNPAVASLGTFWFVVAYERSGDLYGRAYDYQGFFTGTETALVTGTDLQELPDLGSEFTFVDDEVLLVFHNATLDAIQAKQVTVGSGGVLTPLATLTLATATPLLNYGRPRISKTGGTTGNYIVTWQSTSTLSGSATVVAMAVTRNLGVLGSVNITNARNPDVDGNGSDWVVTFERNGAAGDSDVYAASLSLSPVTGLLTASTPVAVSAIGNADEFGPNVAYTGGSCLVGWQRRSAPGSSDTDLFVKSVDFYNCTECEPTQLVVNTSEVEEGLAMASSWFADKAILAFDSRPTSSTYGDIYTQRFLAADGLLSPVVGSCGQGGDTKGSCARVGNPNFRVRLQAARPSATTWLVLSPFQTAIGCGSCTLVADPFSGFLSNGLITDSSGNTSQLLPIPNSGALSGARLLAQWIVVSPTAACPFLGADFSSAAQVIIE